MNILETPKIFKHDQYQAVREVVHELESQNLLTHGSGFCWGMSDLVYQRLEQRGIKSRIVECELTLVCTDPATFGTVGGNSDPHHTNQVATHVIVVTEHPTDPLLIDCSISHILPQPFRWVCAMAKHKSSMLAQGTRANWTLTYRPKVGSKYPALHQTNIIERIKLDEELKAGIRRNKILTGFILALGAILGTMVVYNRHIIGNIENGDRQHERRLDSLERRADRVDEGITKILRDLNEKKK